MISTVKEQLFRVTTPSRYAGWRRGGLLLLLIPLAVHAQTWNEDFLNQPFNLRYSSASPTRIAANQVRDFAVGHVGYTFDRGSYHAIEQSDKAGELSAYIGGLRHIGNLDLQGHLRYRNIQEKNQAWATALWNLPENPFKLCDSIPGDASTESFNMSATAAYAFNSRLRGALEIGISTGSRADQNDPRPRTTTSAIPINLGLDYSLGQAWKLGIAVGFQAFSSTVDYTNIQQSASNFYFIMKGMGDFQKRSTADYTSYHRDYTGATWRGTLSAEFAPEGGNIADFLEVGYATATENARDGSTSYEYKGGDYSQTNITLQDRLQIRSGNSLLHNVTLRADLLNGKATWYDQKRETDLEHGNIQYYRILGSNLVQKTQRLDAALGYQLDILRQGQRDLYFALNADLSNITRKHFLGSFVPKQSISVVDIDVTAGKIFSIGKASLLAQLNGGYALPLTNDYASGSAPTSTDDISADFTRRVFEYETASHAHVGLLADASLPAGKKLVVGLHASANISLYTGSEEYWRGFDGHSRTRAEVGAYLKF